MLRIALATLHLLGLSIAVASIYTRALTFSEIADRAALHRGYRADNWWGLSALILIATGLWRAIAGLEKTSSYYWTSQVFQLKMALLGLILLLEIWPMMTLMSWRWAEKRSALPTMDVIRKKGKRIARVSDVQTILLVGMIVAAVMMARGYSVIYRP
jgi:putative membrane protein